MAVTKAPESATAAVNSKKGKAVAKAPTATNLKGEKQPASHPTSAVMVIEAITKLNEKAGSSLYAIKKYIAEVLKVDVEKQGPFIRRALKKAVETGTLIHPKGKGGSFKLAVASKPASEKKRRAKKEKSTIPRAKRMEVKDPVEKVPIKKPKKAAISNVKSGTQPIAVKKAPAKQKARGPKTMKAKTPAKPKTVSPRKAAPKAKK